MAWQLGLGHCLDKGGKKLPSSRKQTRHIVDPSLTNALIKARSQKFAQRPWVWFCDTREPDTVNGSTQLDMGFSRTRTKTTLLMAHAGNGCQLDVATQKTCGLSPRFSPLTKASVHLLETWRSAQAKHSRSIPSKRGFWVLSCRRGTNVVPGDQTRNSESHGDVANFDLLLVSLIHIW